MKNTINIVKTLPPVSSVAKFFIRGSHLAPLDTIYSIFVFNWNALRSTYTSPPAYLSNFKETQYIVVTGSKGLPRFFILGLGILMASGTSASTVQGGQMTININRDNLAGAFTANSDPSRPSFYVEKYFDAAQAISRTSNELLTSHIVPGTGEISGLGRVLTVNGSAANGFNKATNLMFDPDDLTGTVSGAIGLGGALRYRLNTDFTIDPVTGEEDGNRVITAYFSLEYDAGREDNLTGHSGWGLINHHSFRAAVFDLDNVVTNLTGDSLSLSGDLALAEGFNHLGGQLGAVVGDFNFQTTVVPVPAAFWLFSSALAGLSFSRTRKGKRHLSKVI